MRPAVLPIGLRLTHVSRAVGRAFDDALAVAGGSLPMWLVLLNLKTRSLGNQRELAEAMGIREATLTHHLNAMETSGLVTRHRDPANRRVHVVALTENGEQAFLRLRDAAVAFDRQLRRGISDAEAATLSDVLGRLAANVGGDDRPPWAGLAE
ncbi:MAG TPA: MarR family transcriptional regulator [Chloroflexota bacterium]|jgi:MarR family transcriptional regulator for hemolysin